MKVVLDKVKDVLKSLGYKKLGGRFYQTVGGFYRLIDFQGGAYGNYFFVNLCVHPLGLPALLDRQLVIPERPPQYECILRERVEEAVSGTALPAFRPQPASRDSKRAIEQLCSEFPNEIASWLSHWGSFNTILHASDYKLQRMLTVVPLLWQKAIAMLRFYSALRLGQPELSKGFLDKCIAAPDGGCDFTLVHEYLQSIANDVTIIHET